MKEEEQHQLEGAPASVVPGPGKRKAPEPEGKQGEVEQEVGITGSSSAPTSAPASAASETRGQECQMVIVSSSPEYSISSGLVGRCCAVNAKCQRFQPSTAAADPKLCSTCGHHQSFHHAMPTPSLQQPKRRRTSAPRAAPIVIDLTQDEPEPRAPTSGSCKTPTPSSTPASSAVDKKPSVPSSAQSPKAAHVAPAPSPSSSSSSSSASSSSSPSGCSFPPLASLPAVTCRPLQLAYMRQLKFEVRFAIEQLVASGDLKWDNLDVPVLIELRQHANSFEKAVVLLQQRIKGLEQRRNMKRYFRHSGTTCAEAREWVATGSNKVIAINCRVKLDGITFTGPYEEESNRVVRKFGSDRFLRVSFDKFAGSREELAGAYRQVLKSGIKLGGRNYEMLAWSASQLREGKCYFFASSGDDITDGITADHVRAWLGDFSNQPSLAKYAARMGQAFSKTTPTIEIPLEDCEIVDDIMTDDGVYNFTDGCGEISAEYLAEVAQAMTRQGVSIPDKLSAIQIRWGGVKGMLALNPNLKGKKVVFRKSMVKYTIPDAPSEHRVLEVVKPSRALNGALNRQFITLLHALGVPTESFIKLQQDYIDKLLTFDEQESEVRAFINSHECLGDVDSLQVEIKKALLSGHSINEPHIRFLINALKKMKLRTLRTKARIPIEKSRVLQGVADQSRKLKYGQVYIRLHRSEPPIVGPVVVSKNPCLHPGDFQLLEAVNVPELEHLVGVIVFPTQGQRPHPSEIGGGDLDGDQFFVTWDELLLKINPVEPQLPVPDEGSKNKLNILPPDRATVIPCLIDLFLQQLFNVALGQISNLHQAIAEHSQLGANDPHCLELSALFLRAVDAAKTGDLINIDKFAHVNVGQPHFMQSQRKTFLSKGVLGQLYDHVNREWEKFAAKAPAEPLALDPDLVMEGREALMDRARETYQGYNRNISQALKMYDKATESELKKKHIDRISARYTAQFLKTQGTDDRLRQASAWYCACYEDEGRTLSFPWNTTAGYLNLLKAISKGQRELRNGAAPLAICPSLFSGISLHRWGTE